MVMPDAGFGSVLGRKGVPGNWEYDRTARNSLDGCQLRADLHHRFAGPSRDGIGFDGLRGRGLWQSSGGIDKGKRCVNDEACAA